MIVNNLNEAIILRNEEGNIGYCNERGLQFIKLLSKGIFKDEEASNLFLERVGSMDILLLSAFGSQKQTESQHKKHKLIMNRPFLKLHMDANGQSMNENNIAASAEE